MEIYADGVVGIFIVAACLSLACLGWKSRGLRSCQKKGPRRGGGVGLLRPRGTRSEYCSPLGSPPTNSHRVRKGRGDPKGVMGQQQQQQQQLWLASSERGTRRASLHAGEPRTSPCPASGVSASLPPPQVSKIEAASARDGASDRVSHKGMEPAKCFVDSLARAVLRRCLALGSRDNMTVVLADLRPKPPPDPEVALSNGTSGQAEGLARALEQPCSDETCGVHERAVAPFEIRPASLVQGDGGYRLDTGGAASLDGGSDPSAVEVGGVLSSVQAVGVASPGVETRGLREEAGVAGGLYGEFDGGAWVERCRSEGAEGAAAANQVALLGVSVPAQQVVFAGLEPPAAPIPSVKRVGCETERRGEESRAVFSTERPTTVSVGCGEGSVGMPFVTPDDGSGQVSVGVNMGAVLVKPGGIDAAHVGIYAGSVH